MEQADQDNQKKIKKLEEAIRLENKTSFVLILFDKEHHIYTHSSLFRSLYTFLSETSSKEIIVCFSGTAASSQMLPHWFILLYYLKGE